MDYDYIEMLVLQAKNQDYNAKEKLVDEFTPFIVNHALKSFIYGYEFEDIKSAIPIPGWNWEQSG